MAKSRAASADEDEVYEVDEDEVYEDEAHENTVLFSINPPTTKNKNSSSGPSQMHQC